MPSRSSFVLGFAAVVVLVFCGVGLWQWQPTLHLHGSMDDGPLEGLNEFGVVPQFSLIERDGRRVVLSALYTMNRIATMTRNMFAVIRRAAVNR